MTIPCIRLNKFHLVPLHNFKETIFSCTKQQKTAQRVEEFLPKNGRRQLTTIDNRTSKETKRSKTEKNLTGWDLNAKKKIIFVHCFLGKTCTTWLVAFFSEYFVVFLNPFSYFVHNSFLNQQKFHWKDSFFKRDMTLLFTFWSFSLHAVERTKSFVNMLCIKAIKKRSSHNQSTDWFLIRFLRNFIILTLYFC